MQSKCNVLLNLAASVLDSRACGHKVLSKSHRLLLAFINVLYHHHHHHHHRRRHNDDDDDDNNNNNNTIFLKILSTYIRYICQA